MATTTDADFPCSIIINLPLPTARLASSAQQALQVDQELSPLVRRTLVTISSPDDDDAAARSVLRAEYRATTNRMLRVAVNGFLESMAVVLGAMEELDVEQLEI